MTTAEECDYQTPHIYYKIEQTLGEREAAVHYSLYRVYQQAIESRKLIKNDLFTCSYLELAEDTGYSKRQVKRAINKLWKKEWLIIKHFEAYDTPLYQWLDDSLPSLLAIISNEARKVYAVIKGEYKYQNAFHNYVLDGWFQYSVKQVFESTYLSKMSINFSVKELKKRGLLEQKSIGVTNYFRLPKE